MNIDAQLKNISVSDRDHSAGRITERIPTIVSDIVMESQRCQLCPPSGFDSSVARPPERCQPLLTRWTTFESGTVSGVSKSPEMLLIF